MIILVLIVLGLIWGSFVNAFVWRLYEGKDWVRGRSECSVCHHPLASKDLIPVVSWILLKGRCRYCHKRIKDNPLVELTVPILFVVSYVWWPWSVSGEGLLRLVLWFIFIVAFTILGVYDFRWKLLPNSVVYPLIGLAIVQTVFIFLLHPHNLAPLERAIAGALIIGGGFYILFQVSAGTWIGGGDVKLGVVLGILCGGWLQALLLLFVASLSGTIVAIPLLVRRKAKARMIMPFGPFLLFAAFVVELFGSAIIHWYTHLIV